MNFYIVKRISKKSGNPYIALWCELEDRDIIVTMDKNVIMSIADMSPSTYNKLEVDKRIDL